MNALDAFGFLESQINREPFFILANGMRINVSGLQSLSVPSGIWHSEEVKRKVAAWSEVSKPGTNPLIPSSGHFFVLRGIGPQTGPDSAKNYDLVLGADDIKGFSWQLGEIHH